MSSTIFKVQKNIDRIVSLLLTHNDCINTQMVPFLTENLWERFISEDIRNEMKTKDDVRSAIQLFFTQNSPPLELIKRHPALYKHLEYHKSFFMENLDDKLYLTESELIDEFKRLQIPINNGLNLSVREFMKTKKNYEVEVAAKIVGTLARSRNREHTVVDIGDGKGYLSSRIAIEFNHRVLGVDGNPSNSLEALIRNEKLSKIWGSLVKNEAKRKNIDEPEIVPINPERYQTVSSMIYEHTDLMMLIEKAFPGEDVSDICIAGLHTCGNLGANTLKHFVKNEKIGAVMSIPCCFNLIHEEFTRDYFNDIERINDFPNDFGFPLSEYLRSKKFSLGRNARMLGTQCLERILDGKSLPDSTLYYRSIFELLLRSRWQKNAPETMVRLGKIKRCQSLEEYLTKACKKLNIHMDMNSQEIADVDDQHALDRELIELQYYLRLLFAKPIEALISLDRYLYLLEKNIKHVYLVKLFDPSISPRNLAIIAIKD
jgi:hypothetical protein